MRVWSASGTRAVCVWCVDRAPIGLRHLPGLASLSGMAPPEQSQSEAQSEGGGSGTGPSRLSDPGAGILGVLVVVALLVGLGAWAATIGPSDLFRGDGLEPVRVTPTPSGTAASGEAPDRPTDPSDGSWDWLRWLALAVLVWVGAMLLGLLWWGGRKVMAAWSGRREREPAPPDLDIEVLPAEHRLAEEVATGADRRRALLSEGEPRNAIVACWHEFELAAARAGRPRRRWETPSEFTLTILDLVAADHGAVARLAERYREARFSDHEVTEAHRDLALAALDDVHASLRVPAG